MFLVLGIIIGAVIVSVCYGATMLGYFSLRKKMAHRKYIPEVVIISVAILVSIACKAVFLATNSNEFQNRNLVDGIALFFKSIYSGIGGLTFEGLEGNEEAAAIISCLYYGSSLYAGMIVLSTITAKANYEIYSYLALRFERIAFFFGKEKDMYVFAGVTDDTVTLAKDIKRKYDEENKKCLIIFTGDRIKAFERGEPLNREIMSNGFLYWSYTKSGKRNKGASIFANLGLRPDNDYYISYNKAHTKTQAHVFAFCLSENKTGLEETNSDIVFDELKAMTREMFFGRRKPQKKSIVHYHVLTNNVINYEFYETEKNETINTAFIETYNDAIAKIAKSQSTYNAVKCREGDLIVTEWRVNAIVNKLIASYFEGTEKDKSNASDYAKRLTFRVNEYLREYLRKNVLGLIEDADDARRLGNKFFSRRQAYIIKASDKEGVFEKISLLINDFFNKEFNEKSKHAVNESDFLRSEYAQIKVVSEGLLAGKCLSEERNATFLGKGLSLLKDKETRDNYYRVAILGFGQTGQQSMDALFINTSYVGKDENGDYAPTVFKADVFDRDVDSVSGLYAYNHPLFYCVNTGSKYCAEGSNPGEKERNRIKNIYKDCVNDNAGKTETDFDEIEKLMGFPQVYFHNVSCAASDFIEELDKNMGDENYAQRNVGRIKKYNYRAFIITLGEDEINIAMANALIDDIKHETDICGKETLDTPQVIYVNVRDKHNYHRLNWRASDIEHLGNKSLLVIPYGSAESMYSYEKIVDETEAMKINYLYNKLGKLYKASRSYKDYFYDLKNAKIAEGDEDAMAREWLDIGMFAKESNESTGKFILQFEEMVREKKEFTDDDVASYMHTEHTRWDRFHMKCGYMYNAQADNTASGKFKKYRSCRKEHSCLVPFKYLKGTQQYDLMCAGLAVRNIKGKL